MCYCLIPELRDVISLGEHVDADDAILMCARITSDVAGDEPSRFEPLEEVLNECSIVSSQINCADAVTGRPENA